MARKDPYQYPQLRWPIEIRLDKIGSQEGLIITCPLGIAKQALVLAPAVTPIVAAMRGDLSVDEIVAKFAGAGLERSVIEKLVALLDENLFLATPRFEAAEKEARREFREARVRPPALAGSAYPASAPALRAQIEGYLQQMNSIAGPLSSEEGQELLALIAPHIDYRRGSATYAITYNRLKGHSHDLFILIGTGHQYSQSLFHLTVKDFATPLGVMRCDAPFVSRLAELYGTERSFEGEFLHKREHSLELQLPFLQILNERACLVPILVGSFHNILRSQTSPRSFEEYESFASALTRCIQERRLSGQKICFIAAVDMAHVGRTYGDQDSLTSQRMEEIAKLDRSYLEAIVRNDAEMLFRHIAQDGDARRICGFPIVYTLLDVLSRLRLDLKAMIFDYRQAVDYSTDCGVTFAGAGIYSIAVPNK